MWVKILTDEFGFMQRTNHMQQCLNSIVRVLHDAKTAPLKYLPKYVNLYYIGSSNNAST